MNVSDSDCTLVVSYFSQEDVLESGGDEVAGGTAMSAVGMKTACVTGGNGYIASALIKMLLQKGYAVNTTVRNPERTGRSRCARNPERDEVVRESRHGEARDPDIVGGGRLPAAAARRRRPCPGPGRVVLAYGVSKVLLEKAACKFAEENNISLITVLPVFTLGAAPTPLTTTSIPTTLSLLSGDEAQLKNLKGLAATGSIPVVHVDDVCRAEIFLAESSASGRYICSSLSTTVMALARFAAAKYPQYNVQTDCFEGFPEKPRVCYSSEKLTREGFEFKWTDLDEIFGDLVEYGKALGILPH
uniref:NAD-dependent epimerase/dehydratase domain-containing protein n=1 Tax=Oryza meridionalis TaxID=40149 RepID=A0A0E0DIR4_9ORYZ